MRASNVNATETHADPPVTPEEVRPAMDAHLRALDANGDNGVTLDELPLPRWGRHHGGHPHGGRPPAAPPPPPPPPG